MESSEESKASNQRECVKVAVNIRPLITSELLMGCTDCVTVVPGEPQVQIGAHAFTYDHVYGNSGSSSSLIFEDCVAPLLEALFHGYNATVLAYGQTGSGKTYTMGTNYNGEDNSGGIIPQVIDTIFKKIDAQKDKAESLIRVSFIEIFKEEVFDLLDPNASLRAEGVSHAKPSMPSRAPIQIRETMNGGITLAGVMEAEVRSKEEMSSHLSRGSLARATGSTNMNSQSSRSHAIFTICLEQKKLTNSLCHGELKDEYSDDILFAKLHLVDLAGSERAKRTGADGLRFKEGVHINRGLLALGNVISALGDEKKRKEGGHVPYRDSKLTRLLQDSLGGNSKTVMIACISPADTNAEETINTLKYANRARNIQNKAVVNRDPMASEMQRMRNQLEQLQAELLFSRGGGASFEELQVLRHKVSLLEASNMELRQELKERQITCDHLAQRAIDAQVEKDKLVLKIESARSGKPWDEIDDACDMQECDLVKNYVSRIQDLEAELLRTRNSATHKGGDCYIDCLALDKDQFPPSLDAIGFGSDGHALEESSDAEEDEKERAHTSLQDRLDKELQELDKRLEQKEAEMKRFAKVDTSVLKQHYERKVLELEQEKKNLQKEIEELRLKLCNISSNPDGGAQKLKEDYLQKLNMLEAQVSELKKKQEAQSQLLRQKQKSDDATKRLQEEIQKIKSQKVQLQHKIKQESEQFRSWKATREKEVLQLKKEGRRNEYEMHKLLALNQRQKMVLQRKTEEASMATRRLKELLEAKKAASREMFGSGNANGPGNQALKQAIEHELEVTLRVHEVRCEYERQLKERAKMAKEVSKLKEEAEVFKQKIMSDCPMTMSPSARNSRIIALENMLATSSSSLVSMASQLSEAEERERVFGGRGRWNQVRSLVEAKNLMNYLFDLASSSRCQLRDNEVNCREKDSVISELKEKVLRLNGRIKRLESDLVEREQELKSLASKQSSDVGSLTNISRIVDDGRSHALRKSTRTSQFFGQGRSDVEWLDDMDTSDSDQSDNMIDEEEDEDDEDWVESAKKFPRRRSRSIVPVVKSNAEVSHRPKNLTSEVLSDEADANIEKSNVEACCSCSKLSSCKTKKCECRAAGHICGPSCGCVPSKCANKEGFIRKATDKTLHTELSEGGGSESSSGSAEDEKNKELISQGSLLLENALSERPTTINEGEQPTVHQRKPLSDIGNNVENPNAPNQPRRKNWRKHAIQLIPIADPPPAVPGQQNETPRTREDVSLRLPRAMDSTNSEHNPPFGERNSIRSDESVGSNKDSRVVPSRPPVPLRKASDEKENHMA